MNFKHSAGITCTEHYVAFIDILGYTELLLKESVPTDHFDKYFGRLFHTLDWFKERTSFNGPNSAIVGDAIVLWLPIPEGISDKRECILNLCIAVARLQVEASRSYLGLVIRGGISYGDFYYNPERNFAFGAGFAKAANLEKKKAISPRVVLDPKLVSQLGFSNDSEMVAELNREATSNRSGLADWSGGVLFRSGLNSHQFDEAKNTSYEEHLTVDYLDWISGGVGLQIQNLNALIVDIGNGLAHPDNGVVDKYIWLARYLRQKLRHRGYNLSTLSPEMQERMRRIYEYLDFLVVNRTC